MTDIILHMTINETDISLSETNNASTKVFSKDEIRTIEECKKMSLKEKTERAVASCVLVFNLEMKYKNGIELTQQERDMMARINRELDIIMSDKTVREYFKKEIKEQGNPVIYVPPGSSSDLI